MPEASMYEDHGPMARHEIRTPGQSGAVQPVPQTPDMERAAQGDLGPGVASADSRHHARPGFTINDVRHGCVTPDARAISGE